jgi:YD repeat-containing protein
MRTSLIALVFSLPVAGASAQSIEIPEDYFKQLRRAEDAVVLGGADLGDRADFSTGSTYFERTIVSLQGNSALPVSVAFRYSPQPIYNNISFKLELVRPYISGTFSTRTGWVATASGGGATKNRCSVVPILGQPPETANTSGKASTFFPEEYWHGNRLTLADGSSELMYQILSSAPQPTDGKAYHWTTRNNWYFSCLSAAEAGFTEGEAFVGHAPDGTRYYFTDAENDFAPTITKVAELGGNTVLSRNEVRYYASRIEDRFGNWVKYEHVGGALVISANDGRQVTVTTTSTGYTVSDGTRTWTITNGASGSGGLYGFAVTDPIGGVWALSRVGDITDNGALSSCEIPNPTYKGQANIHVTTPSGLVGDFVLAPVRFGLSFVTFQCDRPSTHGAYSTITTPAFYDSVALTQKTVTGAGLSTQNWTYDYGPSNGCYSGSQAPASVQCNAGSPTWRSVVVTAPDNSVTRYTMDNQYYSATQGLVLKTETGPSLSNVARVENKGWYTRSVPHSVGAAAGLSSGDGYYRWPSSRSTVQDGDTYTWQAIDFDDYGNPLHLSRYSSAGQATYSEALTYHHDTNLWVIGQPEQRTNTSVTPNEVTEKYIYNNLAQATEYWRFGQKQFTYGWGADGNLASVTDGNTHTTAFSDYYLGIPRRIDYPDTTFETATVSPIGQILTATDRGGAITTYHYDDIGRMSGIDYPSGDEQPWYSKGFSYDYVGVSERGIGANHWRRTISKGASRLVTYFDAMLHPVLSETYIDGVAGSLSTSATRFDWKGRTIFQSYPLETATNVDGFAAGITTQYDVLDRPTATIQTSELGDLTTTIEYLSGARKRITDPQGTATPGDPNDYVTTTSYQVFDVPSLDVVIGVQAPEGVNQTVTRDLYGNPQAIRQWSTSGTAVDTTKFLYYDNFHRVCRTEEPESGSEVLAYDDANNVAWTAPGQNVAGSACSQDQVPAAARTTRSYDAMNRVLSISPPAGTPATVYTYDALGNVHTADSGITNWVGTRNKLGMLVKEQLGVTGNGINVINYGHDAYGSLKTITYPDATVVDYAPDALGRPSQAGGFATGVSYFADGEVRSFNFGNGASYLADKNARQLLRNFSYGRGGAALDLSQDYAYDRNGNITGMIDLVSGQRTKSMTYDQLNRLASATANQLWGSESYTYDALNNIRSRISGGSTYTYNYDVTNRLASISQGAADVMTLGYDNRGNVTSKNGNTLVFNDYNQLTSVPGFGNYSYDASGRRVLKAKPGGGQTYYFYSQGGQLMYAMDTATAKATSYIYLGKRLIARNETLQLASPSGIAFDANPNNGSYNVSWNASAGATSYQLDESHDGGASWSTIGASVISTTFAIASKPGGSYLYRVKACVGAQCTDWTVSAILGVTPELPGISVPMGARSGAYDITWTAPASATSYDVREQVDGGAWTTIASDTAANTITRPGTTSGSYKYQVQAKNGYGTRGWAVSAAVTVDTTLGQPPAAPTTLTVPASSYDGNATINWSSAARANSYVLKQSFNGGAQTQVYSGAATSTVLSNLAAGTYAFQVQACNDNGCSPATSGSNLVVTRPPTAAPALTAPANSTNGAYTVSWSTVATATSYILQESSNGGAWTQVQANGNTTWAANGKGNGSYAYRVQACNVAGCGAWSGTGTTSVLLPPPTPTGVTAPGAAYGPFTVTWNASATATSYDVYQSFNGGTWVRIASVGTNAVGVTPSASGSYQFFITANNASGWSGQTGASNVVAVTLAPTAAPSLSVPASNTTGSYWVNWTGVGDATAYQLQEQVNGGGWYTVQNGGSTSWLASGKGAATYSYRVQACNAAGCGPWSNTGSVAVTPIPPIPSGLRGTIWVFAGGTLAARSTSSLDAKGFSTMLPNRPPDTYELDALWDASVGATSYDLQYCRSGICLTKSTTITSILSIPVNGTNYTISVRACNAAGCSAWSPAVTPAVSNG